jgi:cephalosporin hydroxylase
MTKNEFDREVVARLNANAQDETLQAGARGFMLPSVHAKYSYNFSWLGRPIIQYPQDIVAMQEIIWAVQPDLIIETGIAHGGSLIFSASMLELNAACGGPPAARVLGVDVDIRVHNRAAIEQHPMFRRISMIEGSSIAPDVVAEVQAIAAASSRVLVCLDSNHTHDHVLSELRAYAPLTSAGSYCVVFDTLIEDMPAGTYPDRPWGPGNSPKTAVREYLAEHPEFVIDEAIDRKLLIGVAAGGYLRRTR